MDLCYAISGFCWTIKKKKNIYYLALNKHHSYKQTTYVVSSVTFSSAQDDIYASSRIHRCHLELKYLELNIIPIIIPCNSNLFFRSFPNTASETVSILVWLSMVLSLFQDCSNCSALKDTHPLQLVIKCPSHLGNWTVPHSQPETWWKKRHHVTRQHCNGEKNAYHKQCKQSGGSCLK